MADPALVLLRATASDAAPPDPRSGARRPVTSARLQCRTETPPGECGAELQGAADAPDYTGFSMVGVAG